LERSVKEDGTGAFIAGQVGGASKKLFNSSRDLTDMTGAITEFQAKNLKMWPLVAIEDSVPLKTSSSVEVGAARSSADDKGDMHREPRLVKVRYECTVAGRASKARRARWAIGAAALELWTRYMFWPTTEVEVVVNGEKVEPRREDGNGKDR